MKIYGTRKIKNIVQTFLKYTVAHEYYLFFDRRLRLLYDEEAGDMLVLQKDCAGAGENAGEGYLAGVRGKRY